MRIELTLDCVDLYAIAAFWQAPLGYAREGTIDGRYVTLAGGGPSLTLQQVPEPKRGKNRMHLDLLVDNLEAEVTRLRGLGAATMTPVARGGVRPAVVRAGRPGRQRVLRGRGPDW